MATKIDDLFFEISVRKGAGADAEVNKFAGSFKRVGTESAKSATGIAAFGKASRGAGTAGGQLNQILKRMLVQFGGFIILRSVIRGMVGFETAIAEISTIADPLVTDVQELTRGITALARESPQTPDDIGAGAYQILSAGITDTNDALEVLRVATRAATAGVTTTEVAVDAITTVINAFGLAAGDAQRVADVLFTTVRLGRVKFEEIASSIGSAATSAALAGVTIEELSAGIVALTLAGIGSQEATSSLNRLFLTLTSQSKQQAQAFKDLGIEFSISTVKAKGFAGLLAEVAKITGEDIDALAKLFPNIRAARSAFVIAGVGADNFAQALEKLNNAAGATDIAFEKIARTSKAQAQILKNTLTVTFNELGLAVLPTVAKAFSFLSKSISDFILQIKVTGADLAVFEARTDLAFKRIELFAAQSVDQVVEDLARLSERLANFLEDLAATARVVPGGGILAPALGAVAAGFRVASQASTDFSAGLEEGIEEAEKFAAAVAIARDETVKEALAEQEFSNTLKARTEAQREAAAVIEGLAQKTEEQLKAEGKLREQLTALVVAQTKTAVEQQTIALDALEEKFRETFGQIPEDAKREFERLRQVIAEAGLEEAAAQIAEDFRRELEEGLQDIEIETIGIEATIERENAALQRQRTLLEAILARARERLKIEGLSAKEERAIQAVIVKTTKALRDLTDEEKERLKAASELEEDLSDQRSRSLTETASLIQQSVSGALELASAFGIVDDTIQGLLNGVAQLAQGITTVVAGLATGDIASIISGGLGVIGAIGGLLGGGGPSPEQQRIQKLQQANTDALDELKASVDDLRGTFRITGADFTRLRDALETLRVGGDAGDIGDILRGLLGQDIGFITEQLAAVGLTFGDLERVADELGITIRDQAGNIIPEAIDDLIEALDAIEDDLVGFAENIEGAFARFRAEIDIFDITDPIEQFQLLQERLLDIQEIDAAEFFRIWNDESLNFQEKMFALSEAARIAGQNLTPFLAELLAIDVTTPEGRAAADQLIRDLFTQLSEGIITPAELGAATFEEAVQILLEMEGLLDQIAEEDEEGNEEQEGQTQDIRRSVQITELQGNQLLAFLSTQAILQQQMVTLLEAILSQLGGAPVTPGGGGGGPVDIIEPRILPPIEAPTLGAPEVESPFAEQREAVASLIGTVNIEANINVGPGTTEEQVETAREIFLEDIEVELGNRLKNAQRQAGLLAIRRERLSR